MEYFIKNITMSRSQVLSSFEGLSAVVTGGSSGLGFATVERLTKLGCIVAIVDINEPEQLPNNAYFIKTDITSEQQIMNAIETIDKQAGKLDILVNCAGIYLYNTIFNTETQEPHDLEKFERILKVNVTGTFNMIRLCCLLFNKNKPNLNHQRGVIINVSSTFAFEAPCINIAYSTSKAAIVGMTLPLARDLAPMGVRVMTIAPAMFHTPMVSGLSKVIADRIMANILFPKRAGHPDEFAHLVQTIIENPMLNGEVIRLDGAYRAGINF